MAEARVGVRVADDRQSVIIEIGPVAGLSEPIALDLDQLTTIIKLLGVWMRDLLGASDDLEGGRQRV
jgi:hypothetical protein